MAIVQDRLNASKPPQAADSKSGRLTPAQINNNKDLDVDPRKEEQSFFGSFFSASKNTPKKKGVTVMEAVSVSCTLLPIRLLNGTRHNLATCNYQAASGAQ